MKHNHASTRTTVLLISLMATSAGFAQTANPADAMRNQSPATNSQPVETRFRTWEYPVIQVTAPRPLREENLIGSYEQPLWTATRRFPSTRVYVVPEGKMEVEYWLRTTVNTGWEF